MVLKGKKKKILPEKSGEVELLKFFFFLIDLVRDCERGIFPA